MLYITAYLCRIDRPKIDDTETRGKEAERDAEQNQDVELTGAVE
jgi:hypothetical protein